jgi:hypothetical protein
MKVSFSSSDTKAKIFEALGESLLGTTSGHLYGSGTHIKLGCDFIVGHLRF